MATLSDLTRTLANATGRPEKSIVVIARSLREAGLISTGGRGRGGAQMSYVDAANFLLGVGSPGDHTKAARTVHQINILELDGYAAFKLLNHLDFQAGPADDLSPLGIKSGQSPTETLALLMEHYAGDSAPAPDGKFSEVISRPWFTLQPDLRPSSIYLSVTHGRNGYSAQMLVSLVGGDEVRLDFRESELWLLTGYPPRETDRLKGHSFTGRLDSTTIHDVIECVRFSAQTREV